ncbi:MAG TPA: PorV/PorQ family protein [Longimicrobiales bacterium]|nr:PorV/PorQ family protein [Longimicrobiales bacterium]
MCKQTVLRWLCGCAAALLVVGSSPDDATAQGPSDEGAPFLLLPVGARAVALGRAVTAMPGQESAFWNPAGLASVDGSRVALLRGDLAVGTTTAASVLFARPGVGTLGISYLLLDAGDQEYKDVNDNLVGSISLRNHLAVVSAAAHLLPGLDAGVNFKVVQFRLSCRGACTGIATASTTYAVDAGLQWMPSAGTPLRLGAMVAHLGPRFQHENASQADPLPTRVRVAASYDLLRGFGRSDLEGWFTVELQERLRRPGDASLYVGSEIAAGGTLFLRAGYATDADQPGGASVGLGFRVDKFDISVAKSLASSILPGESEPLDVSLSIGF